MFLSTSMAFRRTVGRRAPRERPNLPAVPLLRAALAEQPPASPPARALQQAHRLVPPSRMDLPTPRLPPSLLPQILSIAIASYFGLRWEGTNHHLHQLLWTQYLLKVCFFRPLRYTCSSRQFCTPPAQNRLRGVDHAFTLRSFSFLYVFQHTSPHFNWVWDFRCWNYCS